MKTRISQFSLFILMLWVLGLFSSYKTKAQEPTNICQIYGSLIAESKQRFERLLIDSQGYINNYYRYGSAYKMPGSANCYVEVTKFRGQWCADYDAYDNKADALAKLTALQDEFKVCLPKVEFEMKAQPNELPYFYMKEITDNGFIFYELTLQVLQNKEKKYVPQLSVPQYAKITQYYPNPAEPDTTLLGREIFAIIKEKANYFKGITGPKIEHNGVREFYRSGLCITGAHCVIEEGAIGKICDITVASHLKKEDADKKFTEFTLKLAAALGNKYTLLRGTQEGSFGFVKATYYSPAQLWDISVNVEADDKGTYRVIAVVN